MPWTLDLVFRNDFTLTGTIDGWIEISLTGGACYVGSEALIQMNTTNGSGITLTSSGKLGNEENNAGVISIGSSLVLYGSGAQLTLALGSEAGTIGSISLLPGSQVDLSGVIADIQAIPIPSSMCLLVPGLALLCLVRNAQSGKGSAKG